MIDPLEKHYREMEEFRRRMEELNQPKQQSGGGTPPLSAFKGLLGGGGTPVANGGTAGGSAGADVGSGAPASGSVLMPLGVGGALYAGGYYGSRELGNSVDTSHWLANPFMAQFRTLGGMAQSSPRDWVPNTVDVVEDTPNKVGDQLQRFGSFLGRLF